LSDEYFHNSFQTLTTLDIGYIRCSNTGIESLPNTIQHNKVRKIYPDLSYDYLSYITKTLTTLNLEYIDIGEQGMQYLANALQNNKVIYLYSNSSISIETNRY
jgi:hypothetical protein